MTIHMHVKLRMSAYYYSQYAIKHLYIHLDRTHPLKIFDNAVQQNYMFDLLIFL